MPAAVKVTRERIIHAVLECAFEKSVGGTSLADIAEKLGIKKSSLYNHYESRDAMIDDTLVYCAQTVQKTPFIPADMEGTARRYTAETILKGIANRWIRLHEKEPLQHIFVFLENEKYFSNQAARMVARLRERLITQATVVFKSLAAARKIRVPDEESAHQYAVLFVSVVHNALDEYLTEKKMHIRLNPETGSDTLFAAALEDVDGAEANLLRRLNRFIDRFCLLLEGCHDTAESV